MLKNFIIFYIFLNLLLHNQVNHKMNSYTISNLSPDTTYSVMLCLNKNSNKIPISMLRVTTRPESYMEGLGIVKDYTAIIAGVFLWK